MSNYLPPPMRPDPEIMANAEGIRRDLDEAREAAYAELAKSWSTGRTPAPCGCVQALRDEALRRERSGPPYGELVKPWVFLVGAEFLDGADFDTPTESEPPRQPQEPRRVPR